MPPPTDSTPLPTETARRQWLEALHTRFHHRRLLHSDPLQVLYRFDDPLDREVVGLIAACLAYGNVKAILRGIDNALHRLGPSPRRYLDETPADRIRSDFRDFRYRVTAPADMSGLLVGVKKITARHGDLHRCFLTHLAEDTPTVLPAMARWVDELCDAAVQPLHHLLPHPERGSACKRLNLYLRWMVRSDCIDPGGWDGVRPAQLVIPLDTHMHRIALEADLTRRKQPNLRTAVEITDALRRIRPDDPLRYDFALTRPGIMRVPVEAIRKEGQGSA